MKLLKSKYAPFVFLATAILFFALTSYGQAPVPSKLTLNAGVSIPSGSTTQMVYVIIDWAASTPDDVPDTFNVVVVGTNPDGTFYATTPQIVPYQTAINGFIFFRNIPKTVTNLQVVATANKQIDAGIIPVKSPTIPQQKEDKL